MALTMIGVSVWSCLDGQRSVPMMLVATVGTYALMQVLALLFGLLRPTRLVQAIFSGTMVTLFMPAWDWLSLRWAYPESVWAALGLGAFFGVIRWTFTPRGSSRPPS
ncbi:MAG TPA: hypothetical protein VD969_01080 [Symbiobacteriaceae bacterium]|nr:hypothetical protein [Symbiobacteriaceae bacterium]